MNGYILLTDYYRNSSNDSIKVNQKICDD